MPKCLQGVDALSQVHNENMHLENSLLAYNDWVMDDDAAVSGQLPSESLKRD